MRIRITANVHGGEFVIGTISKKTAEYWLDRGEDDFIEHVYNADLDEDTIPEEHRLDYWHDIESQYFDFLD